MLTHKLLSIATVAALAPFATAQTATQTGAAQEAGSRLTLIEPVQNVSIGHMVEILDGYADRLLTSEQEPADVTARKHWARIRDARTNQTVNLRQYTDRILGAFSGDGRRAAIGNMGRVELFDAMNGQRVAEREFPGTVTCVDISRTGDRVAVCIGNDTHVWVVTPNEVKKTTTHQSAANVVRFDATDRYLFSAGSDGAIQRYDMTSSRLAGEIRSPKPGALTRLELANNGTRGVAAGGTIICLWEPEPFKMIGEIVSSEPIEAVAMNDAGDRLVAAGASRMRTYDAQSRKELADLVQSGTVRGRIVPNKEGATAAIHDTSAQGGGYYVRGWMAWKQTAGSR